jgi:polar amino acid transport system substrate-binding protein
MAKFVSVLADSRNMRFRLTLWGKTFLACILFGMSVCSGAGETLRLRADLWMPYNGDPAAEHPGFAVELAKAIFEPQNIKVDYETMPWVEALEAAREGRIEGVIGASPGTETKGLTVPQESIGEPRVVMLVRKDSLWQFENNSSLKNIRLGVIEGYSYWDSLDEYIKANSAPKIVLFKGDTPLVDALTQLKAGKIDAVPETMAVFVWTAKGMGLSPSEFRIVHTHQNEPIYMAFSNTPAGVKYAKLFDEGMQKLRASGKLAALLKSYGMTDWK